MARLLFEGIEAYCRFYNRPDCTARDLLGEVECFPGRFPSLETAMEFLLPHGRQAGTRALADAINRFRDRVYDGKRLVKRGRSNRGVRWAVVPVEVGDQ